MITINEIAKIVNLSKSTISKYLNGGTLKPANKQKVDEAIAKYGYRQNYIAKSLKTSKTHTIGILIPFLTDIFAATIISAMEQKLNEHAYSVMIANYNANSVEFKNKMHFMYDKMVDMIVVFPSGIDHNDFAENQSRIIPFLTIDKVVENVDASAILIDNIDICYKATKILCENGHRKIAIITGHQDSYTAKQRVAGCKKAFEEFNISPNEYIIKYGNFSFESGDQSFCELKETADFTAVFATNYYLSNGVLKAANNLSLSIPEDFSFIGFDSLEISNIYKVPLVLATQPMNEIGERAADYIVKKLKNTLIDDQKVILLKGTIKTGSSIKRLI